MPSNHATFNVHFMWNRLCMKLRRCGELVGGCVMTSL